MKNSQKAFTLIELLVVISIISLLSSIVLENLNTSRDKARLAANEQFEANILHGIGDQLVGEWKFNEGAGTAIDTSGYGNNGTVSGATWSANGGYDGNGAYTFNGSNYITLGAPPILNFSGLHTFTEAAWINPSNYNSPATIFGRHTSGGDTMATLRMGGGRLEILLHTTNAPAPGFYDLASAAIIPLNKWSYVAVVYDGSSISFYINGSLDSKYPATGTIDAGYSGVVIGRNTAGGEFFTGKIDTVRIYTATFTAAQIQNIYAAEKGMYENLALK